MLKRGMRGMRARGATPASPVFTLPQQPTQRNTHAGFATPTCTGSRLCSRRKEACLVGRRCNVNDKPNGNTRICVTVKRGGAR